MIEATCSACGTLNRIAEADVPAGAKFVNCSSCKSRVALPIKTATAIPGIPGIPKPPPKVPPPTPKGPPAVALGPSGAAPPPVTSGPTDIVDLADLPAPRRQSPLGAEPSRPAPRSALASAYDDLPAPRPPGGGPPPSLDLDDLMGAELPAPRPTSPAGISDLPAPKARPPAAAPAYAPPASAAAATGVSDLPAPKARPAAARPPAARPAPTGNPLDLPAPRSGGISDLPTPRAGGVSDLPTPKPGGASDLMTPKGGRQTATAKQRDVDLPTPKASVDLPAPKGFFDDLPQPSHGGRGSDRPEVPAPKGFFDDLPQPARKPGEDIAPKGFFDDLPGRAPARSQVEQPEVPAPKGFFDDLPQPARSKPEMGMAPIALDLGEDDSPIDLAEQDDGSGASFDQLDLSKPSVGQNVTPPGPPDEEAKAVIRFGGKSNTAAQKAPEKAPLPSLARAGAATDGALELEEPKPVGGKLQPKRARVAPVDDAGVRAAKARRSKILLGSVLGLAIAGGGGFFLYQRHAAAKAREEEIDTQMLTARKALVAEDAGHWQRAMSAASKVIELDSSNSEALGIAAEASFAGAFADGKQQAARFAAGRKLINDALSAGVTGPALDRAQALSTLTTAPDKAVPRLTAMLGQAPKDGTLALYLGWAQALSGDPAAAAKSFDQAMTLTPSLKILALDGRARAKLALADVEGARSDFNEILALQKDNVTAQVGVASTLPQSQAQQQEADLLAILQRKDIATADPRAVVAAWVLAGDDALRGRRLDAARERFRKALAVDAKDISALTALAETELRDRKFEIANEQIGKALTQTPNDVRAQLVAAEIELKLGKMDSAAERLQRLGARTPPLVPIDQARLKLITGRMLEDQGKDEAAVDAYAAAAKLAGDFDLTPTMAAIAKLSDMARKASEARNPAKEAELRARADQLLSALADKAMTDPQLAMTLGVAYLQSGDPTKAEPWLRRVVEARPTDADALYQYGRVLGLLAKFPEAIESLKKARDLAPGRSEIGLELAITYERTKSDGEAAKLYDELVARDDASLETRAHAGKFYVRMKRIGDAGKEGTKIVAADPDHAAGHYLKGEGLLAQERFDDARKEFGEAVARERDPMYLDGQGRAAEALAMDRNKDGAMLENALRAYQAATELDPLMFSPLLGAGRIYVTRREHAKAIIPLVAAQQIRADDAEVAFLLGIAYQELGQKKEIAIRWLEFSLAKKPNGDAAFRLGNLYADEAINKPAQAQAAYAQAVRLGIKEEKAAKEGAPEVEYLSNAMHELGRVALDRGDEATAKAAWEKWIVRPGASKKVAQYEEARRALATTLKTVGPTPLDAP
ncbi:MAG: tetratricopeptide repeat protein [Myxococcales bacterium]|nr:tetratricopeptide repeat protein [Myxococcales bacterium]